MLSTASQLLCLHQPFSIYENQPHAFVKSVEEIRKDPVQSKAWNEVLTFLKQTLQSNSSLRDVTPPQAFNSTDTRGIW